MSEASVVVPDTKDWTWVLDRPCPECGFDASAHDVTRLGAEIRTNAQGWVDRLAAPGADQRPAPATWSTTEYACHVRDVHLIFGERVRLMLDEEGPTFPNWDQDETAVAERYDLQRPAEVAAELLSAAEAIAVTYDGVRDAPAEVWARPGFRSNGSEFTLTTIGLYHLHDVVHHAWDTAYVLGGS